MNDEDKTKDQALQDLMTAMDNMSAHMPQKAKETVTVASADNPSAYEMVKDVGDKLISKGKGEGEQGFYINKPRNDVLNESEAQSVGGLPNKEPPVKDPLEGAHSMKDDEEEMPGAFSQFVRSKRRG